MKQYNVRQFGGYNPYPPVVIHLDHGGVSFQFERLKTPHVKSLTALGLIVFRSSEHL